jgi:hypothetical protein
MVINITLGLARLRCVMLDCGCGFAGVSLAAPCAKAVPAARAIATARVFARADKKVCRSRENSRCAPPLRSAAKAALENKRVIAALKSVRENFSRPSWTRVSLPLFPALKRRAIGRRPSGAGFLEDSVHRIAQKLVFTHTLKRCATQNQARDWVFPQSVRERWNICLLQRRLRLLRPPPLLVGFRRESLGGQRLG